ncbi:MAG: hypothetical protein KM312_08865 [Hydrogenibacillus schlegelii]|uniref:Uncharacterized protein n=1 Tax=Hydrogenibacillus schlegelii TaxID=1484 RepID=A0A947CY17_HYDSH|nr:hypothetical protein [Hydrogenibacillus schlegelii]
MNYDEKIQELEERIKRLETKILWMALSKLPNPRNPYYEWLLYLDISDSKRELMEQVLVILSWRLENQVIPEEFKKPVPGIPYELLYSESMPSFEEAETILSIILELNNRSHIISLLKALYRQGRFQKLCRSLLEQIGEEPLKAELYMPF